MKNRKKEILIIAIILILQTIIYVCVGANKAYLHIDEAYSFGLTNYERIEIQDNEDFYDSWHNKEYYEEYLSIQDNEVGDYKPVYENQKNDVHPPLYYLMLRIAMNFTKGHFSKWPGIILNIIIYTFVTIFMYLILKKLFKEDNNSTEKSAILAFISSIVLASVSNVIYIRMYSLSTLIILITTYLHIKLLEKENVDYKLLISIGITVLAGVLTHYYYLFYLVVLYLVFLVKYIKEKKIKQLVYYTLTMLIAGIISLVIFPYSIQHMFFGYRGQGVISKLGNVQEILPSIQEQVHNLNYYVFNNLMYIILVIIFGIIIYNVIHKKQILKINQNEKNILKLIYMPTIFFFIIATIASPWNVLRYIVPVCGLIFILVIYYLYKILQTIFSEKATNIFVCILLGIIIISPFIFKMQPELWYKDKKEILKKIDEEINVPTIYLYNTQYGRFLDDMLLFAIIDESYIAKDIECTEENIQKILKNKDISNGIIILINEESGKEEIIENVKNYLNFTNWEHIHKMSGCNAYYIK